MRTITLLLFALALPQLQGLRVIRVPVVSTVTVQDTGWVTQALELAPGRATSGLKAGAYPTQPDVLSRYPDGSIKMAAITYLATTTGPLNITTDANQTGTLQPVWPSVVTTFTPPTANTFARAIGATFTATLGSFSSADCWFSGPLMTDCRKIVRAQTSTGTLHPTLEVTYDIRSYQGGGHRVSVTLDNIFDTPGLAAVGYNADVAINGQSVWSLANLLQPVYVRARAGVNSVHGKVFIVGTDLGWASEDRAAMEAAHAVPPYRDDVDADTYGDLTETPNRYLPFQTGAVFPYMGSTGVREDLSEWPDWCIKYLVHPNEQRRAFMLAQAEASGAWSYNLTRSRTTRTPVDLKAVTFQFGFNATAAGSEYASGFAHIFPGAGANAMGPATHDFAHFGGLSYFAWLVTADRFYADQLRFSAWWRIAALDPAQRAQFPPTEMLSVHHTPEGRGIAHSLREIHDGTWLPTEREAGYWPAFFREATATTLHTLGGIIAQVPLTPAGGLRLPSLMWHLREGHPGWGNPEIGPNGEKMWGHVVWEVGKILQHMDHAMQSGLYGSYGVELRDQIVTWLLSQWRDGGVDYPPSYIGTYIMPVGYYTDAFNANTYHFYTSWKEIGAAYRKFFDNHGFLNNYGGNLCVYGPHEYPALVIAVRESLPGAAAALALSQTMPCGNGMNFLDKIKNDAAFAWRVK